MLASGEIFAVGRETQSGDAGRSCDAGERQCAVSGLAAVVQQDWPQGKTKGDLDLRIRHCE